MKPVKKFLFTNLHLIKSCVILFSWHVHKKVKVLYTLVDCFQHFYLKSSWNRLQDSVFNHRGTVFQSCDLCCGCLIPVRIRDELQTTTGWSSGYPVYSGTWSWWTNSGQSCPHWRPHQSSRPWNHSCCSRHCQCAESFSLLHFARKVPRDGGPSVPGCWCIPPSYTYLHLQNQRR